MFIVTFCRRKQNICLHVAVFAFWGHFLSFMKNYFPIWVMLPLARGSAGARRRQPETIPLRRHHESDPQEALSIRQEATGPLPVANLRADGDPWGRRVREQRTESRWGIKPAAEKLVLMHRNDPKIRFCF